MKAIKLLLGLSLLSSLAFSAKLNLKKSKLKWEGSKITGKHYGEIFFKSGELNTKSDKITGGSFVVDMASFNVTDLSGETAKKFLGHMKSKDFFEVKKFPTAKLKITKVDGPKITAKLTIKGKTNPVTFKYTKSNNSFIGKLKFDRTKFDMIYGSGNFFKNLGDKVINDEVSLDFKLVTK